MKLIVVSGLPGTGKSSVAKAVGKRLKAPEVIDVWRGEKRPFFDRPQRA